MPTGQFSIDEIFAEALCRPQGSERASYLDEIYGQDAAARERVERLLRAHAEAHSFLEAPAADPLATMEHESPIAEHPGIVIGPYKLLQQIGEGGYGVVFVAEQERPVRRRVALKVIKPGMDTREIIARFEAERQALAMMDHPNIAKVHDAGATENGRPYFVMELVQGVPITDYCDQCNLTTRERLELFITVCQAVQHAHQKGVIHRDIKPTNVLVAIQDGQPAPKIIDFGIAKAIGQKLTEHTLMTAFAQIVGTPLYMSPEQAELSPLGVDTRSDIYSLGVLLYELLTGTTPFDKDRLHAATYDELRRIIREEEPPRPSARLSTLAVDRAVTIAEHRRTDARRLRQTVRGELDWIVMKCLEKDRNRRYETPNSLARDVERYLHDEPVQACPPSASYRFRKFARRNKAILAAGGAIAAALLMGLGLSTWMYFCERAAVQTAKANEARATTESARARAVSELLQETLGSADAGRSKGVDYKVRELLDDFAGRLHNQLTDQPDVDADIQATIGRAYRSLRLPDQARSHFEKAIELRRRLDGPPSEKLAGILVDYGWNLHDEEKYSEAESQLNEALDIYRRRRVTGGPLFHALEILQHVLISSGRDADAERVTQEALAVASRSSEEFPDQANLLHRYADLRTKQERYADAEKLARQAIDMHRRLHGEHHPETAWALWTLARALTPQQKHAEAEQALRDSLEIFRRQFPLDHPDVRGLIGDLSAVLQARGDKSALETLAKEQAAIVIGSDNPDNLVRMAALLLANNAPSPSQKEEAHRLIRRAIEAYRRAPIDSPNDFRSRMNATDGCALAFRICASTPGFAGEVEELSRLLRDELPQILAAFPDSTQCQWETAMGYITWGHALSPYGDYLPTAEYAFGEAIEILEKMSLSEPERLYLWTWLADSYAYRGDAQSRLGRLDDAEAALRRAIEVTEEHAEKIAAELTADPGRRVMSEFTIYYLRCALLLAATAREQEAAEFVRKAVLNAKRITDPTESARALYWTALTQVRLGDDAGYRETCRALVDVPVADPDDSIKANTITALCLAPDALNDSSLLVSRAKEFVATNSLNQPHIELRLLGAALFRDGQYDQAAERLEESIAIYPSNPLPAFDSINYTRLLLAMAKWQLGQKDEARRVLAEAKPYVDKELYSPASRWNRRTTLQLLRDEAEAMIGRHQRDVAPNGDNPKAIPND